MFAELIFDHGETHMLSLKSQASIKVTKLLEQQRLGYITVAKV